MNKVIRMNNIKNGKQAMLCLWFVYGPSFRFPFWMMSIDLIPAITDDYFFTCRCRKHMLVGSSLFFVLKCSFLSQMQPTGGDNTVCFCYRQFFDVGLVCHGLKARDPNTINYHNDFLPPSPRSAPCSVYQNSRSHTLDSYCHCPAPHLQPAPNLPASAEDSHLRTRQWIHSFQVL